MCLSTTYPPQKKQKNFPGILCTASGSRQATPPTPPGKNKKKFSETRIGRAYYGKGSGGARMPDGPEPPPPIAQSQRERRVHHQHRAPLHQPGRGHPSTVSVLKYVLTVYMVYLTERTTANPANRIGYSISMRFIFSVRVQGTRPALRRSHNPKNWTHSHSDNGNSPAPDGG